ncbi:MAG TPA: PAS domain S-box protein [Pyrinomonadaceae bacterium]
MTEIKTEQTRPTVLAVNDEPKVLELLTVILEREGYKVVTADSGRRALELARTLEPDIVISDVVMPEMDGLEFCRRLKQDPQTAHVPVLLASAVQIGKRSSLNALTAGADDYLELPFRRQELLVKVARLTERHRIERRYRELVEQAADIIYTRDMEGRISSINEAGARFFGRPVSELIGAPLSDLFGEEAAAEMIAQTLVDVSKEPSRWVHRVRDADGIQHYLEGIRSLVRDAGGNPVSVRCVVRDITERKIAEEALRESDERFKAFMDNSPAVAFIKDEKGRFVYINKPFERFFELNPTEWQGKTDFEMWPAEIAEQLRENDRAVLAAGHSVEMIEAVPAPDGVLHHWLVFKFPLKDAAGRVHLAGMAVDITERKRTEEALKESEERYRDLFENIPIGIYRTTPDGRILMANSALVRMLGYSSFEELAACNLEDEQESVAYPRAQIKEMLARDGFIKGLETGWRRRDGSTVYLRENSKAIRGEDGTALLYEGTLEDITERKQTEEALKESELRYRDLFENANDIIYTHDLQGNFTSLNKTGERITGYTREEAMMMNIGQVVVPEHVEKAREMIARKATEDVSTVYELDIISKGGLRVPLEVSTRIIRKDGKPVAVQGIARDVTERKRVEAELQASEAEMRALFSAMTDVILLLDAEGRYLKVAPTNPRLLYKPPAELIGKTLHEVFPKEQADTFLHKIRHALETNQPTHIDYSLNIDGAEVWFEGTVSPMLHDSVVWVARDITERKRSEEALEQQVEREAVINRISSALRRSLDPTELFQAAVRELGSYLSVDRCSIFMKDEEAGRVRMAAEYHVPGVRPVARDFPLSKMRDLVDGIDRQGALAFDDAANDERLKEVYNSLLRVAGVRSILYVGIKAGDEMPAAFALSTTRSLRHWRKEDIALARAVANQTGVAIRQAELYQKAEATSARESLINRLSLAIRASLSLSEVMSTATRELGRALSTSRVHLYLYDPADPRGRAEHEYVAANSTSIKHLEMSFDEPIGQRILRSPGPIVISDALNYEDGPAEFNAQIRLHAAQVRLRSQIIYPLIVNGRFRGALCIHQTDRVRRWSEDEVALVEAVAAQLATGIAQAELFEMTGRAKKEWETTFNAMSDGIFIFDNAGQLIRVNRAGAAMEDTWPHLMLGRRCCDILRTSEGNTCIVERTIAEGRSVTIEIVPERFNRPLLVTAEPIIEKGSQTTGAVCTARDLSELRKAEAKAREHQSLLMNILESARESIYAVDTEGRFQWCNSATISATGYKSEALIGQSFLDITFDADRQIAREHFERTLEGKPQTYEARFFSHDGQLRHALFDTAPLIVDGQTTGVLGIARDITEQKQERQRAAQADKLRALGQLASGVAHDFNNALTAILGRAQLMRRQVDDSVLVHNLEVIQTAAEDAAATVRRIQTFARQSPAKEFELLDASLLLRDAIEITRTRWENEARLRGLHYDVALQADCPQHVMGNASELREVFVNLIVNAVDAMPRGGSLDIGCENVDGRLILRFKDTGVGMTEDVRERIFEPFYTTKGAQGTGLGLAVSYGIIERHEGHFNVESEAGSGTTFEIDLPAAGRTSAAEVGPAPRYEAPSMRVLVIDDEEFVRETLADMLIMLGHKVTAVGGGRAALQELASRDFDLVFTDLSMPEMDGWEVAREIRRRRPEMTILLVTGHGAATPIAPGDKHLVNGIIGKPFDFDQVAEMVAKATKQGMGVRGQGSERANSETEISETTLAPGP